MRDRPMEPILIEEPRDIICRDTRLAYMYPNSIELDGRCKPIAPHDFSEGMDD